MPEKRVGTLRLRAVRFKSGGEIRLMPPTRATNTEVKREINAAIDRLGEVAAGVALVAWGADGGSVAQINVSGASRIPFILVPDFVRSRLLANAIEHWTLESIKNDH